MTTPADEISAAARKLRTLTEDLGDCRGPWYVVNREQRHYPQRIDNIGVPYVVASTTTDPSHPPTIADYICAMHPGVGKALADWLESTATSLAASTHPGWQECVAPDALAVARAINGGPS
jgi:hypothetical protein